MWNSSVENAVISCILFVYQFPASNRSGAANASRIVLGRPRPDRPADEQGFVGRAGVVRVSRGVLLLPLRTAEELADRLRVLGASIRAVPIRISPTDLEAISDVTPTRTGVTSGAWRQPPLVENEPAQHDDSFIS